MGFSKSTRERYPNPSTVAFDPQSQPSIKLILLTGPGLEEIQDLLFQLIAVLVPFLGATQLQGAFLEIGEVDFLGSDLA